MAKLEALTLPLVTFQDLQHFQIRHFGSASSAVESIIQTIRHDHADDAIAGIAEDNNEDYTDGLGFYPDGVKRTLTDEQIAMFRHSEIYNLLREKQLRMEREVVEKEIQDVPNTEVSQARLFVSGNSVSKQVTALEEHEPLLPGDPERAETAAMVEGASAEDDDMEFAKFLLEEKEQQASDIARKQEERGGKYRSRVKAQNHTHRRIARELDASVNQGTFLDYDDGPHNKPSVAPYDPEEKIEASDRPSHGSAAREDRRIWWPTLGTG